MNLINLKLAFRNLGRNKLYTFINISGLSLACAFCILTFWYVKSEQSFDNFHDDQDRLFRIEQADLFATLSTPEKKESGFFSFLSKDDDEKTMLSTPAILAGDLESTFPQIQNTIRLKSLYDVVVRVDNQSYKEKDDHAIYADEDFFKVLSYPLIYGNKNTALSNIKGLVISERAAKKYFGYSNPLGKRLELPNEKNSFYVAAVMKDFPSNSSFQYDIVIPRTADVNYNEEIKNGKNSFADILIIKLKPGTDIPLLKRRLTAYAQGYYKEFIERDKKSNPESEHLKADISIRPLADAHYNQSEGWDHYTSLRNINQFIILSVIILVIAGLNYVLLTLTNTVSRSQDVGVRKTIGAGRIQIIWQYFTETQLLALICALIGYVLALLVLPFFNDLVNGTIDVKAVNQGFTWLSILGLSVLLGLLAGIYPALIMSGLKPLNIMRGFSTYKINPFLSKALIVVQFSVCVMLIISTLIISKQMQFVNTAKMGFDTERVLLIRSPYNWTDKINSMALRNKIYNYAASNPSVAGITSGTSKFAEYSRFGHKVDNKSFFAEAFGVDFNYFEFNKIPIVLGRDFSRTRSTDSGRITLPDNQKISQSSHVRKAVVVNETLYKLLGKPPMERINTPLGAVIIGVCKDYHTDDLTKEIAPVWHAINTEGPQYYWIKIKADQSIAKVMDNIRANWDKMTCNSPFTYSFADDEVKKSYDAYQHWMQTITVSCFVAIFIACLGLFGLSGVTTLNRAKEIGIRKILGASISNLFILVNRNIFILAMCAFAIAAPVGWYFAHQWLENFAYRIKPDWSILAIASTCTMVTAFVAVSYHTLRAAFANPVKSLRNE